jgi:peptide-methionine (S)-S-oxide reductase
MMRLRWPVCVAVAAGVWWAAAASDKFMKESNPSTPADAGPTSGAERATFAAGCFWCVEAVFQKVDGVASVKSGYIGGHVKNPTYQQVCGGNTGHAEAIQIEYDPNVARYEDLLDLFWRAHDPTQLNRQGADVGTQYRSAIFYHSEAQRVAAEASKKALAASGAYPGPIVTEISPATEFYTAEAYHQNYYRDNPRAPYCALVIRPKMKKLGLE